LAGLLYKNEAVQIGNRAYLSLDICRTIYLSRHLAIEERAPMETPLKTCRPHIPCTVAHDRNTEQLHQDSQRTVLAEM